MTGDRGPVRTCVGCRSTKPAAVLTRLRLVDGEIVLDGDVGRGAWLCTDSFAQCAQLAIERRAFDRAFRQRLDSAAVERFAARRIT